MDNDQLIKDAQYRKGLSIAFFNATNAAIELVRERQLSQSKEDTLKLVTEIRNFFLEEHKTYYANVIAKVGTNFKPEVTKAKLSKAVSLDSLKSIWQSLSEDERRNEEIKKFTQTLKKNYEKA